LIINLSIHQSINRPSRPSVRPSGGSGEIAAIGREGEKWREVDEEEEEGGRKPRNSREYKVSSKEQRRRRRRGGERRRGRELGSASWETGVEIFFFCSFFWFSLSLVFFLEILEGFFFWCRGEFGWVVSLVLYLV
jgi:hypothetical protein